MRLINRLLLGAVLVTSPGCGGNDLELATVSGTVLMDGIPVQCVFVIFKPEGLPESMAVTDRDGYFELQYNIKREGAPLGKHDVRLMTVAGDEVAEFRDRFHGKPTQFPEKYTRTFETVEVVSGHNEFLFELTTEGAQRLVEEEEEEEEDDDE